METWRILLQKKECMVVGRRRGRRNLDQTEAERHNWTSLNRKLAYRTLRLRLWMK
jgi:hypothetical protein